MDQKDAMALIATLLKESDAQDNNLKKCNESLLNELNNVIMPALDEVSYSGKTELVNEYIRELKRLELFCLVPQLIGKTIIGIIPGKAQSGKNVINLVAGKQGKVITKNSSVPLIVHKSFSDDELNICALSKTNSIITLTKDQFNNANKELYKHNIDIRNILKGYILSCNNKWDNIIFVVFPSYVIRDDYFNFLIDLLDEVIVCDNNFLLQDMLQKKIKTVIFNENEDEQFISQSVSSNVRLCNIVDLDAWLSKENRIKYNFAFLLKLKNILNDVNQALSNKAEKNRHLLNHISSDIVMMEEEAEFKELLNGLKFETKERLNKNKKDKELIAKAIRSFNTKVDELQEVITVLLKQDIKELVPRERDIPYLLELADELWNAKKTDDFNFVFSLLDEISCRYSYLIKLGVGCDIEDYISRLNSETLNCTYVNMLKFRYAEQLKIDKTSRMSLLETIKDFQCLNDNELCSVADFYKDKNLNLALKYLFVGVERGSKKCSDMVVSLYELVNDPSILYKASGLLDPKLTYCFARYLMNNSKIYDSQLWMRISASLGNYEAVLYLADYYYYRSYPNPKFANKNLDYTTNGKISLQLYQYLDNKGYADGEIFYKMGKLYANSNNYNWAMKYWSTSNTSDAMFLQAMYYSHYYDSNGEVELDLLQAKKLLEDALSKGHTKAKDKLESVKNKLLRQQIKDKKEKENENNHYHQEKKTSTCSSSCCFVITATCLSLGIQSNALAMPSREYNNSQATIASSKIRIGKTLALYHKYRAWQQENTQEGSILIPEYYRLSSSLIDKIKQDKHADKIYGAAYSEYIQPSLSAVQKGNFELAQKTTIEMMIKYCKMFGVEIDSNINTILQKILGL